jgi:hypothetical protein
MSEDRRLIGIDAIEPYPFLSSDELYDLPAPRFIIEDFLPEGSISGITSYPGVGKTWFAFEMARAMATGGLFLNNFQATEGAVLFVGSDASIFDYARQWRRLTHEQFKTLQPDNESSPDYENPLKANVKFLIQSDFLFESRDSLLKLIKSTKNFVWGPLHETYDEATGSTDMVRNTGFALIVFDTLSKLTRANQNDNSEMEEVFRNIRLLSETTGAAIMMLHHNAKASEFKDGEDWRGAMAQIGALDNWFQLTPARADKDTIQVKIKKFRGITPQPFFYKADVNSGDPSEEPPASLAVVQEPKDVLFDDGIAEAAVEMLRSPAAAGKWFTLKQVCDSLWTTPMREMLFGEDRVKFETAVRNRLKNESRKTKPTIRMAGGGTRGRKSTFSALIMEQALAEDDSLKGGDDETAT